MTDHTDQRFSSRLGLLLCVLGIAVGTGNIWRFPRIAAQNAGDDGAGAFLVAWIVFLFVWSVPLIIAEYALGRKGRMGVVGTFAKIAGEKFAWMGAFVGFVATAIMFYYSVVAGWCVYYLIQMTVEPLPLTAEAAQGVWDGFQAGGFPVAFHALAMGLVDELAEDPRECALAWVREHLVPLSAASLRFALRAVRSDLAVRFTREIERVERLYLDELMATHDAREGLRSFLEKRKPAWRDE